MDNFRVIYKILKHLETSLDYDETDYSAISAECLKISEQRWEQLLIMLQEDGYIEGIKWTQSLAEARRHIVQPPMPTITLKGLEYLAENSVMKKVANAAKGIVEVVKP